MPRNRRIVPLISPIVGTTDVDGKTTTRSGGGKVLAKKPATRMDVVNMLVSGLKLRVRVDEKPGFSFTDIASLSPEERQKLAIAVLYNLIAGAEGKSRA